MGQVTIIGGTDYKIIGGKTLIGGTMYNIKRGKTLIGGTGYDINFKTADASVIMDGTWPNSTYADIHLLYDGVIYRSGTVDAYTGDTITVVNADKSNPQIYMSVKVNDTWVFGTGGWGGIESPCSYDIVLTGNATFSLYDFGGGVRNYIEITVTM